ncbi:MAG TPA: LuxR C-terminal-related transcriptional regulator, partial [Candidatus Elarobacter sp.]|nr:LuxR C-terminal-related transcriptional regulator [Candidatus Elarobacter sp.]
ERVAFISVLDAGVYKLHDLFRDFVQRQVQLEGDEALRAAQVSAGRLLERMGMFGEALERFSEARAAREVERVLAEYNFTLLEKGWYDIAERALRTLAGAIAARNPRVLALRAALEDAHGRVDQAERWYGAVMEQVRDADIAFGVAVASRYALLLYQQGRFDAVPILEAFRDRPDLKSAERTVVLGMLAMTYAAQGRHQEAQTAIAEAIELSEFADDATRVRTYTRAAAVAFYASDDAGAESYTREASRLAIELGEFGIASRAFATLTAVNHFAGRIPVAAWYAAQVSANAEKAGDTIARVNGLRNLLAVEAERGNEERIVEIDRELSSLSYRGPMALFAYATGKAMLLTWQRQLHEAQLTLTSLSEKDLLPYQSRLRHGYLAAVFAKLGARNEAIGTLNKYEAAVEADDDPRPVFDRLRATGERYALVANIVLERNAVAQRAFRSLRAVTPDFKPFDAALAALINRIPEDFQAALRDMRLAGIAGHARTLEELAGEVRPSRDEDVVGENTVLTPVELEVLRAMANGLSNQAIADTQHRAMNTVRTHVSSILRKLGCANRGEAVATARRRELV